MRTTRQQSILVTALICALAFTTTGARADDPLRSWNDGAAKQSIVDFVGKITKEDSPDFVPPAERIATFDHDGTLWGRAPDVLASHVLL
jgi:hypothetical protein